MDADTESNIAGSVELGKEPEDIAKMASNSIAIEQKKSALNDLQTRKKQLDFFIHDLQSEKSRYNRMVRSMVKILQQEILNRGRTLAKQIDQSMDERIEEVRTTLQAVNDHMRHLNKDLKDAEMGETEDSTTSCCDYNQAQLSLPSRDPFIIDMEQTYLGIRQLQVKTQKYVEEPFPERENFIKAGVEVEVAGVGFWDSQRPTFHLMPREEEPLAFLYRHSQKVRMSYLSDKSWQTCRDAGSQPSVGRPVFACHPDDRCWYRALVIKNVTEECQSSVKFVDYGETKSVPWSDILPFKKDLYSDSKPWAFECTLAEDIDPRRCQDARWFFNATLYEISRACVPLKCTPIKQVEVAGETVWLVDLKAAQNDGSIMDIGKQVKEKMSLSNPQSSIACRDIREEFQTQLSEMEKERQLKKAEKAKEEQKAAETGSEGGSGKGSSEQVTAEPTSNPQTTELNKEPSNSPQITELNKEPSSNPHIAEQNNKPSDKPQKVTSSDANHVTSDPANQVTADVLTVQTNTKSSLPSSSNPQASTNVIADNETISSDVAPQSNVKPDETKTLSVKGESQSEGKKGPLSTPAGSEEGTEV